jgi:hypothetical protein
MRSYKVEVIADRSGQWASNALRFANYADAENWAHDLWSRWLAVRDHRIVTSEDEPNR